MCPLAGTLAAGNAGERDANVSPSFCEVFVLRHHFKWVISVPHYFSLSCHPKGRLQHNTDTR